MTTPETEGLPFLSKVRTRSNPNHERLADFFEPDVISGMSTEKQPERPRSGLWQPEPLAYLITFTCYGCHLPGHAKGSIHRRENAFGTPALTPSHRRVAGNRRRLRQPPYHLSDPTQRKLVMEAIRESCRYRSWGLIAAHVRTNHLHGIVQASTSPEEVIKTWKGYASRRLNRFHWDDVGRRRWTRGGSRKYLWYPWEVSAAVRYVIEGQGKPLEVYLDPDWRFLDL